MKKKVSSKQTVQPTKPVVSKETIPGWETFFRCQRNPVLRSQLLTALMAGRTLVIERIPKAALADAVLLCMAACSYHAAEIVDSYQGLLRQTEEIWAEPLFTHKTFDQTHLATVNFVIRGSEEFSCEEEQYTPAMVAALLACEKVPEYFVKEL